MIRLIQQRSLRTAAIAANQHVVRQFHSTPFPSALSKFSMPAMSPTMTEGGISSWKKKEGESFAPGDVLVEIETDKASMDVEAQEEGFLVKIIVGDGSKAVKVGTAVAIIAEEGDDASDEAIQAILKETSSESSSEPKEEESESDKKDEQPEKKKEKEGGQEEQKSSGKDEAKSSSAVSGPTPIKPSSSSSAPSNDSIQPTGDRPIVSASPIAKRLALEKGIPLFSIKGTGPNGRIIKADIESYKSSSPSTAAPSPSSSSSSKSGAATPPPTAAGATYTDSPVSNMRRTIATRLQESKSGTPHYYLTAEINMDRVDKLREVFNAAGAAAVGKDGVKAGTKLSVNDFIVKASALALQDVSEVNSGWHGEFVRQYLTQDISIAVATPTGLITPIVRNAGAKGLATISAETKTLAGKAREGKLKPEEYQGGSFTISNLGMMGVESFTAIINPPQSCILAIGASEKKLVLDNTAERGFKEVTVMKVTMSCDHRVVDGAVGAKWLKSFKSYLESPLSFML